jgi:hypothetical protein
MYGSPAKTLKSPLSHGTQAKAKSAAAWNGIHLNVWSFWNACRFLHDASLTGSGNPVSGQILIKLALSGRNNTGRLLGSVSPHWPTAVSTPATGSTCTTGPSPACQCLAVLLTLELWHGCAARCCFRICHFRNWQPALPAARRS